MAELFSDLPEALENTVEIAKRCNIEVQLGKYFLPDFPTPNGMGIDDYLRHASFEGLEERLECCCRRTPRTTRPSARSMSIA